MILKKNGNDNLSRNKMLNHNEENDKINSKKDKRSDNSTIENNDYEVNDDQN